jgi:hypothetical protein
MHDFQRDYKDLWRTVATFVLQGASGIFVPRNCPTPAAIYPSQLRSGGSLGPA